MISKYDFYSIRNIQDISQVKSYDLYISAYNNEKMIYDTYEKIHADKKIWCILLDYKLGDNDKPKEESMFEMNSLSIDADSLESEYINTFFEEYDIPKYKDKNICIDITGFVKPYIIYFIYALKECGFKKIDIIYLEPKYWEKLDDTVFSKETIIKTRPINGFEKRQEFAENDLHIIAAGYDHKLVRASASFTKYIKNKQVLIGFPSLQPSMYQENILNFQKSSDELSIDNDNFDPIYAPANDPFEVAKVLKKYIDQYIKDHDNVNTIYISPLSTKPHAIGMLLFFLYEKDFYKEKNIEIVMLYTFTKAYSSSSGKELSKVNLYTLEF